MFRGQFWTRINHKTLYVRFFPGEGLKWNYSHELIELFVEGIFFGSSRESFSKKNCPKRNIPTDFVKFGPEILYLFLAEKRYSYSADLLDLLRYN